VRVRSLALRVVVALTTPLPGCLSGVIYSHVTVPLDVDLDRTPVHAESERDFNALNSFQYYIRVDWGSDGIGDIAKKNGFTRIDYADLETLTVLWVWSQQWARVYGEKAEP